MRRRIPACGRHPPGQRNLELGGDGEELGQCTTSIDFLVEVIAVEEPVGRFTNLAI